MMMGCIFITYEGLNMIHMVKGGAEVELALI